MNKFKVGNWCFCEFKLQQIKRIEDGEIMGVTDGLFEHGGQLTDRCFPMDMKVKIISDNVMYWNNEFFKLKNNALNHPDLNWKLIDMWVKMCHNKDNEKKLKELYEKLNAFGDAIVRKVKDFGLEEVDGVRIFRR